MPKVMRIVLINLVFVDTILPYQRPEHVDIVHFHERSVCHSVGKATVNESTIKWQKINRNHRNGSTSIFG